MKTLTLDDDLPATARRLIVAAEQHGWTTWTTEACGTPIDGAGQPQRVTKRVPLVDSNTGLPLMTEGKPATNTRKAVPPRQRIEVVTTDEPLVVHSIVVRLRKGAIRIAACWEGGRFDTALQQRPFRKLTSPEVVAIVTEEKS